MLPRFAVLSIALISALLSTGCKPDMYGASWSGLPREQVQSRLVSGEYQVSNAVTAMPAGLQDSFRRATRQLTFQLAEPTATGANVPARKLVFWASSPSNSVVHYVEGKDTKVLVFEKDGSDWEFVWGGQGTRTAANMDELKQLVAAGEFKDDQPYWW